MAGVRAQPDREALFERPLALSESVFDPGRPLHRRALFADLHRSGLRADPSIAYSDALHGDLWIAGQAAHLGRGTLYVAVVCRVSALVVVLYGTQQLLREPDQQCQPAHEDVLPVADRSGGGGDHQR
jgi:hypothetical protein